MSTTTDVFSGLWKANTAKSNFDPNYRPREATMHLEPNEFGYELKGEGVCEDGKVVTEGYTMNLDGLSHPVPGAPGMIVTGTRPAANTIRVEATKDGEVVGEATYTVSADGTTLTASTRGMGVKGPFVTTVAFDRHP